MLTILLSDEFDHWLVGLKDRQGKARILARLRAASLGHFGDVAPVGGGMSEMRIHDGPGYRLSFRRQSEVVYVFLVGGDKSSQGRDIRRAKRTAATED